MKQLEFDFEVPILTKEKLIHKIKTHRGWAATALIAVWKRQTAEEQRIKSVIFSNGKGFNSCDVFILSKISEYCLSTHRLTDRQWAIVRRRLPKYWKQLLEIAEQNKKGTSS